MLRSHLTRSLPTLDGAPPPAPPARQRSFLRRRGAVAAITGTALVATSLSVATAAHAATNDCGKTVDPAISAVQAFLGGSSGALGCPTANTATARTRDGSLAYYNEYTGGATIIRPSWSQSAAFLGGAIRTKWKNDGGFMNWIGLPTSHTGNISGGQMQTFQYGNIYTNPALGTFNVSGPERDKYVALGSTTGPLGWPVAAPAYRNDDSDVLNFQGGAMVGAYQTPGVYSTFAVYGDIFRYWVGAGREDGSLGYPLTDEQAAPSGNGDRYQEFEGGAVTWNHVTRGITRTALPRVVSRTFNVSVNDTSKVHPSNFKLTVSSDGHFQLTGHLYDSSDLWGDKVALGVKLGDTNEVIGLTSRMTVHQDKDVNLTGTDLWIRSNYPAAAHSRPAGKLNADGDFWGSFGSTLKDVFGWAWANAEKLIAVGGAIFAV